MFENTRDCQKERSEQILQVLVIIYFECEKKQQQKHDLNILKHVRLGKITVKAIIYT